MSTGQSILHPSPPPIYRTSCDASDTGTEEVEAWLDETGVENWGPCGFGYHLCTKKASLSEGWVFSGILDLGDFLRSGQKSMSCKQASVSEKPYDG